MGGAFDDIIEGSTADVEVAYEGANDFDGRRPPGRPGVARSTSSRDLEALPEADGNVTAAFASSSSAPTARSSAATARPGSASTRNDAPAGHRRLAESSTHRRRRGPGGPGRGRARRGHRREGRLRRRRHRHAGHPGEPPTARGRADRPRRVRRRRAPNGATLTSSTSARPGPVLRRREASTTRLGSTADGVSARRSSRDRRGGRCPAGFVAAPATTAADEAAIDLMQAISFLNTFLLVFAGVALVVGTFLIINTFSILVAQRSRELALLRALGASRRQVNRSVLLEASASGSSARRSGSGSATCWRSGCGGCSGRSASTWPAPSFPVEPTHRGRRRTPSGILVTVVAAYLPARRRPDRAGRGAARRRRDAGVDAARGGWSSAWSWSSSARP